MENEEKIYEIVLEIINKTLTNGDAVGLDDESLLMTILKTEGLDIRDKVSGVIGKSFELDQEVGVRLKVDSFRFSRCWFGAHVTHSVVPFILPHTAPRGTTENLSRVIRHERSPNARRPEQSLLHSSSYP